MNAVEPGSAVMVTGASSQIGVFLLQRLLESGYRVCAITRAAPADSAVVDGALEWAHPDSGPGVASDAGGLVSAAPLESALRLIEKATVLKKAVVFSTTSIESKKNSPDAAERALVDRLRRQEDKLKSVCRARGISLVLIRPTLVYGCGLDRNLSRLLKLGDQSGLIPLSSRARGLRQPVHAEDLTGLAATALKTDTGALLEGAACGGETITYREMTARVARCCNRKVTILSLPPSLLAAIVRILTLLGLNRGANAQMVYRQATDLVFDDHVFRERLEYAPRAFDPTRADFGIGSDQARYRPFNAK